MTDTGTDKVLDFGLAKLLDGPVNPRSLDDAGAVAEPKEGMVHTAEGALLGTRPFMPSPRSISAGEEQNPYAGLSAFQERDAERFFGRARATMEVTTRLGEQPLIAVVGPSGAGKSSFVRAGVIPALRRSGEAWEAFILRPGPHPRSALAELVLRSGISTGDGHKPHGDGIAGDRDALVDRLRAEPGLLGAELSARARRRLERVLVFVDQFEELSTARADQEACQRRVKATWAGR